MTNIIERAKFLIPLEGFVDENQFGDCLRSLHPLDGQNTFETGI